MCVYTYYKYGCTVKARDVTHCIQPDSQGPHVRYPHYGEDPDTGWSRAPRFWVPRGAAKRGRGGKGSFVYKRVNY